MRRLQWPWWQRLPYQLHGDSPLLENRQIRVDGVIGRDRCLKAEAAFFRPDIWIWLTCRAFAHLRNVKTLTQQAKQARIMHIIMNQSQSNEVRPKNCMSDRWYAVNHYRTIRHKDLPHFRKSWALFVHFESTSSKDIQTQEKIATSCRRLLAMFARVWRLTILGNCPLEERHTMTATACIAWHHKSKGWSSIKYCCSLQRAFPITRKTSSAIISTAAWFSFRRRACLCAYAQQSYVTEKHNVQVYKRKNKGYSRAAAKELVLSRCVWSPTLCVQSNLKLLR